MTNSYYPSQIVINFLINSKTMNATQIKRHIEKYHPTKSDEQSQVTINVAEQESKYTTEIEEIT